MTTGLRASDLVARGFPFGSGQEMTVNIKDRFHHRKLGVGSATLPAKLNDLNRCTR
jgi:hypothetical protein